MGKGPGRFRGPGFYGQKVQQPGGALRPRFRGRLPGNREDRRGDGRGDPAGQDPHLREPGAAQREIHPDLRHLGLHGHHQRENVRAAGAVRGGQGRDQRGLLHPHQGRDHHRQVRRRADPWLHCGHQEVRRFHKQAHGRKSGEAGGAALPYQDERHGRRFRGEGYHQAGQEMGNVRHRGDGPRLCTVLPGRQPRPGQGRYLQGHLRRGGVSGGRHQAAGGEFQEPELCRYICGF